MTENHLLNSHRKPDSDRVIRSYDFKETNRFPKECMNILDTIHDNYVRLLTSKLSARLGGTLDIQLKSLSQMTYEEYVTQGRHDMVSIVYEMAPMEGLFYLNLNNEVAFLCIDTICGGAMDYKQVDREFTEVEKSLLKLIAAYLLEPINGSWKNYLTVETRFKTIEVNLENTQYLVPHDLVVAVDMEIKMPSGEKYLLNFILPYHSMESQIDQLVSFNKINQKTMEPSQSSMDLIGEHLRNSFVDLNVILGKATLTLSEINHLKVGDIFPIDTKLGELLSLVVEEQEYFRGQLGIRKKKLAVQVLEILNKHSEGDV